MLDNSKENLKEKTKKGLYWSFFNQFTNYGMQFCVGIVMARLLSPSDYGITALPAVFMSVAWYLQNGGLSDALVRKLELKEEDLSTSFYYSIGVGVILYTLLFLLAPFMALFYETPILTPLIRVTALGFLWGPAFTTIFWLSAIANLAAANTGISKYIGFIFTNFSLRSNSFIINFCIYLCY